jgi:hypothetical protein
MNLAPRLAAGGLAVVFSIFLSAAVTHAEDATFGIAAGATLSLFSPPDTGQTIASSAGLAIGFYAVIPILKSVSFLPELFYVQKYARSTIGSTSRDLQIEYVELPLLAKMPFFWGTYFTEGVALGFPVQQRGLAPNLALITSPDVAVVIGGGYDFGSHVAIEFRYDAGLRRVSTLPTDPVQRERSYMAIGKLHF